MVNADAMPERLDGLVGDIQTIALYEWQVRCQRIMTRLRQQLSVRKSARRAEPDPTKTQP